jgi:hypothetical protein
MSRNNVLQISSVEQDLMAKVDAYQAEKNLKNRSEAGRALLEFAFRVLEHKSDDEAVSSREILEELLAMSAKNWNLQNNVFFQTYNESKYADDHTESKKRKKVAVDKAQEYVDSFLAGEMKEGD